MYKNNVFNKYFKRTLSVVLCGVTTIALAGCSSADKNPEEGLDTSSIYASAQNYDVTVGELYNELKHGGVGYLSQSVEEVLFKDYLDTISTTLTGSTEEQQDKVAEYILEDLYGTSDEDEIALFTDKQIKYAKDNYVDTMALEGYKISFSTAPTTIKEVQGSDAFSILWDEYRILLAKYYYSYDVLTQEIADHNDEAASDEDMDKYFTDKDVADYYTTNYAYDTSYRAVIIRFLSQDEANNTLRKFGIKAYNNEWYLIQPPVDNNEVAVDGKWKNETAYNKYYDEYDISQSSVGSTDIPISLLSMNDSTIFKLFVEIYNYIYTYRTPLTYDGQSNIASILTNPSGKYKLHESNYLYHYYLTLEVIKDGLNSAKDLDDQLVGYFTDGTSLKDQTTYTKDQLDTFSTSLTTYLYETLRTTPEKDDDGNELDFNRYSAAARSYNDSCFLLFKLADITETDFYTITEDEDGNDVYTFTDTVLYNEILEELKLEKITDSYITSKANDRADYVSIEIYDSTFEFYYAQANLGYTPTKGSSDNLVALVTFKDKDGETIYLENGKTSWEVEITVEEVYNFLESISGTATATALLFDKYILDSTYYSELKDDDQTYKDAVYTILANFTNDAYSSNGYPSSVGKYTFMKQYFRTANVDEAVVYIKLQEAKRQFFIDVDDDFYSQMTTFSENAFANYYSLTLTNIIVYADFDEDGTPDDLTEWKDKKAVGDGWSNDTTLLDVAELLIKDIVKHVEYSSSNLTTAFSEVVAEYNSSTRIIPDAGDSSQSFTKEAYWAKYKAEGLYISTSELGEYNNTTDLEEKIQDLVKNLYEDSEVMFNDAFSGAYLIDGNFEQTEKGYNLLLVTSGTAKTAIDFENEEEDIYKNVPIRIGDEFKLFDLTSSKETATEQQVELYCREYFENGSSVSLSTTATSHLDTYLNPLLTKYNSYVVQLMSMKNVLGTVTSSNTTFESDLDSYIKYLQRVSDNYSEIDIYTTNESTTTFWDYIENSYKGGNN